MIKKRAPTVIKLMWAFISPRFENFMTLNFIMSTTEQPEKTIRPTIRVWVDVVLILKGSSSRFALKDFIARDAITKAPSTRAIT